MLADVYKEYTVYVQECPKDFNRPSFLLEFVKLSQRDANRITVEKTVYFTITCFTEIDKHYRSDREKLASLQENVLQLFAKGYVAVGDRAVKVQGSNGGMETDRAYIDLQFEYFDNRTDEEDDTPLIASVTTKIKEEFN